MYCKHSFRDLRSLKYKGTWLNMEFSNTYPLSNPEPGILTA